MKKFSEEHRKNLSISHKGQVPWSKGRKFSEVHRQKLSDSHKGKKWSETLMVKMCGRKHSKEWNKKISIGNKGKCLGKFVSEETKRKLSESHKGNKHSKDWRKKVSESLKGRKKSENHRKKISEGRKGIKFSEEQKKKMSEKGKLRIGEKSNCWRGGISFEPYSPEFNKQLKEQIRQRDNYRCQQCFRHQDELRTRDNKLCKLIVHHIDYNKKNSNPENLISLCRNCHSQTNFGRKEWQEYFNDKLQINEVLR